MVTSLAVNKKKFQCLVWVLPLLHQAVECISVRFVEVEGVYTKIRLEGLEGLEGVKDP